jgi:hypothetical protein
VQRVQSRWVVLSDEEVKAILEQITQKELDNRY